MNPQAQRIAIAEACGWKDVRTPWPEEQIGFNKMFPCAHVPWLSGIHLSDHVWRHPIPDYPLDLSAMHSAERMYETKGRFASDFVEALKFVILSQAGLNYPGLVGEFRLANATASQRAEAFLRVVGKWVEEPTEKPI